MGNQASKIQDPRMKDLETSALFQPFRLPKTQGTPATQAHISPCSPTVTLKLVLKRLEDLDKQIQSCLEVNQVHRIQWKGILAKTSPAGIDIAEERVGLLCSIASNTKSLIRASRAKTELIISFIPSQREAELRRCNAHVNNSPMQIKVIKWAISHIKGMNVSEEQHGSNIVKDKAMVLLAWENLLLAHNEKVQVFKSVRDLVKAVHPVEAQRQIMYVEEMVRDTEV